MIASWLARHAATIPDSTFLSWSTGQLTYRATAERVASRRRQLASIAGRSVGLPGAPDADVFTTLLALDGLAARVFLLPAEADASLRTQLADRHKFTVLDASVVTPAADEPHEQEAGTTEVVLFTSGTTGTPKAALHTWTSLAARVHESAALAGTRWLLTYGPFTFAGLQVLLHALANGGMLSFGGGDVVEIATLAVRDGVTHVSATPTFFRVLLATVDSGVLDRIPWTQITLGGEPVDQSILDALIRRFPKARVTHIYASTEAGVGFSVHDGRAGFPASWIDDDAGDVQLRIVDGELQIRSPAGMQGYLTDSSRVPVGAWRATGDRVTITGDRVFFLGRESERINVGGLKLFPAEVERVLLAIPGVQAARVHGTPSPMTGQIVAADIVLAPGVEDTPMRAVILATCRAHLPAHKLPRILRFVESLDVTPAGKLRRE